MKQLRGKVAVITGAAHGIGRALASRLAKEGCALALSDIDEAALAESAACARAYGTRVTTARLDVADRAAMEQHADAVVADHGRVNLVVNNAGVALAAGIQDTTYEDFEWLMGIDFWGVVYGTKAFLPHLKAAEEGHVVNISSVFGLIAVPGNAAYHAAKFAVRGFTECLRQELELEGVRVSATCVHPGGIKTNIVRHARIGERGFGPSLADPEQLAADFERVARTTPEQAADAIVRGVRRNARRVLIGRDAWLVDRTQRWLPTAYQKLVLRVVRGGRLPI